MAHERVRGHVQLATLLSKTRRYEQAKKHYEHALQLLATQEESREAQGIRCALADVLARLGERHKAMALYEDVLAVQDDCVQAHVNLAAQLIIDDEMDRALRHCQRAIALDSAMNEAYYNLNVILRRLGRHKEAVEQCWTWIEAETGLSLRPQNARRHEQLLTDSVNNRLQVSVVCVKWGAKYASDYVDKLCSSIRRNVDAEQVEVEFVCLTDDPQGITSPDIAVIPLEDNWNGWWNKIQLFSPRIAGQLREHCVYIDLDTVIVGDVTSLLQTSTRTSFALLRTDDMANERRTGGYNSSIIVWHNVGDIYQSLYEVLKTHFSGISTYIYKLDHWFEMMLPHVAFVDDLEPQHVVEYQSLEGDERKVPENARVVCFPLQPKPHQATAPWISTHWQ
ncbi:hypothetical protein Poli38472_000240 [Pythium oligandrum]|uniref:Uncharacterized protein n=1 Tax=Pythium oligandrum TaxID=41045 RepID=A0A8K1CBY7_PYTOL|nr:hypothetical protein Poli38472_000240 [Pythium oligandrum]|eukprot:TMW60198.1 hypothetical protein Poli38472_000240 [Pythium oligandrum]